MEALHKTSKHRFFHWVQAWQVSHLLQMLPASGSIRLESSALLCLFIPFESSISSNVEVHAEKIPVLWFTLSCIEAHVTILNACESAKRMMCGRRAFHFGIQQLYTYKSYTCFEPAIVLPDRVFHVRVLHDLESRVSDAPMLYESCFLFMASAVCLSLARADSWSAIFFLSAASFSASCFLT
jgi:hypothetical protein